MKRTDEITFAVSFQNHSRLNPQVSEHYILKPVVLKGNCIDTILDRASPQSELSVTGASDHDANDLRKQDISEFISLITQVYSVSPQLIHSRKRSIHRSSSQENTSKFLSRTFQDEEKFLNLLREMVKEMDNMQDQFLSAVNTHVLDNTEEEYKVVNQRLSKLNLVQEPSVSVHLDTSTYSVVEDEKKTLAENKKLKDDLEVAEENIEELEQKNQDQADEISHLKDIIKSVSIIVLVGY